jgi:hypothetical protein
MASQEEIDEQLNLLATYRRTLAILLEQKAKHTSANVPTAIEHGIIEARENIRAIKKNLLDLGVKVENYPSDEDIIKISPSMNTLTEQAISPYSVSRPAIVCLISGFFSWLILPMIATALSSIAVIITAFPIGAIITIITAHWALEEISLSGGKKTGKVFAKVGLIVGYGQLVLIILFAIWAILQLMSAFLGVDFNSLEIPR